MSDCDELRRRLMEAKRVRNQAFTANAKAEDEDRPVPFGEGSLNEMRANVDTAARLAREAGCDIDDLVARNVGDPDSSL